MRVRCPRSRMFAVCFFAIVSTEKPFGHCSVLLQSWGHSLRCSCSHIPAHSAIAQAPYSRPATSLATRDFWRAARTPVSAPALMFTAPEQRPFEVDFLEFLDTFGDAPLDLFSGQLCKTTDLPPASNTSTSPSESRDIPLSCSAQSRLQPPPASHSGLSTLEEYDAMPLGLQNNVAQWRASRPVASVAQRYDAVQAAGDTWPVLGSHGHELMRTRDNIGPDPLESLLDASEQGAPETAPFGLESPSAANPHHDTAGPANLLYSTSRRSSELGRGRRSLVQSTSSSGSDVSQTFGT